jgi:2-polyprenyl-6-methoxyphenol hydroxylase-like FAD-dependent oxidoreductase
LLEKVVCNAEPITELHAAQVSGRTLIRMPYPELGPGVHAYGLHRGDLFQVLHEAVLAHGVQTHLGCEVREHAVDNDEVFVRNIHGQRYGPFDFLLATDGSRSALRASSRLKKWVYPYDYGTFWVNGRATAVRRKLYQVVRGSQQMLGILPMGQGRCSFYWGLRNDRREALYQRGFEPWRAEVLRFCPQVAELFEGLTGFQQVTYTTYQHVWMPRCHDDHVLFLGDAAHAMSPHLGQGVNLALLDAWHFARTLQSSADHRQAFRRYRHDRARHLRYYSFITFLLSPFFQSNGFIKALGRDLALPIMHRLPVLRGQMLLTLGGVKSDFFGGWMRGPSETQK